MAKQDSQSSDGTQEVETPILDMNFDFADAPPAIVNQSNDNERSDNKKKKEKEEPKKSSIRKVNPPKPIKRKSAVKEDNKVEQKKMSKSMKRVRNNLRIDMVGFEQKPNYAIRSNSNKRRK